MGKGRLEAFSDGVMAIVITIMVLELKVPHGAGLADLTAQWPVFLSYLLSFVYVGIYWNNHHHFLHAVARVDGRVLWANLHLLFWLSLLPFATAWMGENHFAPWPMAVYGTVLLLAAVAWLPFQHALLQVNRGSALDRAVDPRGWKSLAPVMLYTAGIACAFVNPWIAGALYVAVAVIWFLPDRRIEDRFQDPAAQ